jgi:hypothetical protein
MRTSDAGLETRQENTEHFFLVRMDVDLVPRTPGLHDLLHAPASTRYKMNANRMSGGESSRDEMLQVVLILEL